MNNFEQSQLGIDAIFQKTEVRETLGNRIASLEFIRRSDYQEFKRCLIDVNGTILNIPDHERGLTDADIEYGSPSRGDVEYLPPHPEDKDELLKRVYMACKTIRDPKDIALLIYLSLQAIHPFADGNGRTGRAIYNLLTKQNPPVVDRAGFAKKCVVPPQDANSEILKLMLTDIFGTEFYKRYGNKFKGNKQLLS